MPTDLSRGHSTLLSSPMLMLGTMGRPPFNILSADVDIDASIEERAAGGDHAVESHLSPEDFCFTIGTQPVTVREGLRRAGLRVQPMRSGAS
jgi:hypothetical protein